VTGASWFAVTTGAVGVVAPGAIVATNDSFTLAEDSGARSLDILTNDTGVAGGTVTLLTQPRLGTASVNPDGSITYTPNLNANGADAFTYQVATATAVSNSGNVAISLTPVNDPTTAVNDGPFTAQAGVSLQLPNVLDNDIDADGRTDLVDAVELTATTPGATVSGGLDGVVTFSAATPGNYTFTYRAKDKAGILSNPATVIVNVIGADTVVAAQALFRTTQKRWVISGTDDPAGSDHHARLCPGRHAGGLRDRHGRERRSRQLALRREGRERRLRSDDAGPAPDAARGEVQPRRHLADHDHGS
jgi:hypothetical protein